MSCGKLVSGVLVPVRMGASVMVDQRDEPDMQARSDAGAAGLNSGSSAGGGTAQSGERVGR